MFSFKRKDEFKEIKSDLIFVDLSESNILTKEELNKTLSKIPKLKLKPNPIDENIKINSKNLTEKEFDSKKIKLKNSSKGKKIDPKKVILVSYLNSDSSRISFSNPIPEPMIRLNLYDFCQTDIDWKLLTILRPENNSEEEYFSKLVELYQLRHKTRIEDGFSVKQPVLQVSRHPRVLRHKTIKFSRMDSFCFHTNHSLNKSKEDITYEAFARIPAETRDQTLPEDIDSTINDILAKIDSLDFKSFQT